MTTRPGFFEAKGSHELTKDELIALYSRRIVDRQQNTILPYTEIQQLLQQLSYRLEQLRDDAVFDLRARRTIV